MPYESSIFLLKQNVEPYHQWWLSLCRLIYYVRFRPLIYLLSYCVHLNGYSLKLFLLAFPYNLIVYSYIRRYATNKILALSTKTTPINNSNQYFLHVQYSCFIYAYVSYTFLRTLKCKN